MKKLDFTPAKSTQDFRNNYKLHDIAEYNGRNLLLQWGFNCTEFGEDNRYKKVWEKGEDKPDAIIYYKNKAALLDWKGKHGSKWLVNKRAINSYKKWSEELGIPVVIAFFVIDNEGKIIKRNFAVTSKHKYKISQKKQWDKNITVEFANDIPEFTKANLINELFI
jgi:hypothetical protein